VEDQPADSGDLTTDAAQPDETTDAADETVDESAVAEPAVDEPTPAPRRRRWAFFRGRSKTAEAEPVSDVNEEPAEPVEPEDSKPERRTPVGKAGRTAKQEEEQPASAEEPADETTEAEVQAEEANESDLILVPHRAAGRRLKIAAVTAAALFVGAAAFAAATLQPYLTDRAMVATKLDVARTAANAITTLWTYTPDNMDSLPDRSAGYLGGDFAHEYRKYIDAIVAPNKQAQVTNTTQVVGTAVETLTPSEATAIVYTNSVATSPVTKNIPSLRYLSYRLTMERRDAKWLITRMSTVTSLDLTPRL
jgi:Mce-associated membrane protein